MYPILARFSWGFLYSYTAVWGVAMLLALGQTAWLTKRPHFRLKGWLDGALVAILGGLLGGRLGFLLANHAYFQLHPAEAWQVWNGGFNGVGVMWGAFVLFGLWGRLVKGQETRPWTDYADLFTPALALCYAAGWLACGLEGCGYGQETFLAWYTADLPDRFGVYAVRYPTQWWGMGAGVLLWLISSWGAYQPRFAHRPSGFRFWLTVLVLNVLHLFIMPWLAETTLVAQGMVLATAVVAAMVLSRKL